MAAAIPPTLKSADITRFAQRAGQLEKAKPVVAYWCNYWIVEQILAKGLHQKDDECKNYTMNLMDKLEQTKSDYAENDAISDDMAGQAYIELFGLETFQRAENAMKANRASRQTADTFQAAATFLDLCQIWGPLEPEIASKIKFAKYHSLRILKAIKAGEDPNLSYAAAESEVTPADPEAQILNAQNTNSGHQPSVEEVPDEHDGLQGRLAQRSTYDESLHPSRAPSVLPQPESNRQAPSQLQGEEYYRTAPPKVSPLASSNNNWEKSEDGGYFPRVPDPQSTLPDPPPRDPGSPPVISPRDAPSLPHVSGSSSSNFPPPQAPPSSSLHSFPPPSLDESLSSPFAPPPTAPYPSAPTRASVPSFPSQPQTYEPVPRPLSHTPKQPPSAGQGMPFGQSAPSQPAALPSVASQESYLTDEEAVLKAQKHARWAISALNFEDIKTAVRELRGALESLGAR